MVCLFSAYMNVQLKLPFYLYAVENENVYPLKTYSEIKKSL